ncbi:MAG: hypothetical protein KF854_14190 [Nitrospira sp.]|nr:hypothetical protein [Nitrospira sp.]HNA86125.1 hypothetical protein [Nitrospira sp.]HNC82365.1 hypothetical protein [Nitrospira sp.]
MMRVSCPAVVRCLVLVAACQMPACGNTASVFDLETNDPKQDQKKIAEFYAHEATRLRQMAQDYDHRVAVYERLFGPHSDWVEGTRLLSQSYEAAAQEQERIAARHQRLHDRRSHAADQESR